METNVTTVPTIFLKDYRKIRVALGELIDPTILIVIEKYHENQELLVAMVSRNKKESIQKIFRTLKNVPSSQVPNVFLFEARKQIPGFFLENYLKIRDSLFLDIPVGKLTYEEVNRLESCGRKFQEIVIQWIDKKEDFLELIKFFSSFYIDSLECILNEIVTGNILDVFSVKFIMSFISDYPKQIYLLTYLNKFEKFEFEDEEMKHFLKFIIHTFSMNSITKKFTKSEYSDLVNFLNSNEIEIDGEELENFKKVCQNIYLSFTRDGLMLAVKNNPKLVKKIMDWEYTEK